MKTFKKYFFLKASPADVYNALVNPVMLEIWTGEKAVMSEEPGSEFSLWDGSISGKNVGFVQNEQVVQEWYFGEDEPPSQVILKLHARNSGTDLEVHQTGIPDEAYDNIAEGWMIDYIGGLKQLFEE